MKTILIVGATGTIGKALCFKFQNENIITAGRDCKNTLNLDFSKFNSILNGLEFLKNINVDIVFLNSGTYLPNRLTLDGIEENLMVNAFSPYYFIKRFVETHSNCKIILTTSISILRAELDFNPKEWHHIYRNTKLLEYLLIRDLEIKDKNNTYCYAHPGICISPLSKSLHSKFIVKLIQGFGNSLENSSNILYYASLLEECKDSWVCPKGFLHLRGKEKKMKIKKNLSIDKFTLEKIIKMEQELEEKYGI